ncbi:HU family DNA-binding protein [Mageeibacillus indolicus]|jgi:hypothetical protein|uniref:DNA-binding protein HU n=2 Tax=Mageeibacillus indolicus TaxID=884684 RepID=D3R1G4_MAGIU|nr:HU family DNA-binding protein [Mageeibacillus indolicus]ADC91388.1 DNA-binding protein HU [Mageeibacillus indolicus UPII9-5]KFA57577.1 DNA-binding protein [Mageeibacillus indolicus 0009-5]PNH19519.1 integration host factor subunit alpha [Mageeibacillus indolicus]
MKRNDLIASIAKAANLTKKSSEEALDAVLNTISDALIKGDKVILTGFGTFEVRARAARKGRNPATKTEIMIPASKSPAFKPGKRLKEQVNK